MRTTIAIPDDLYRDLEPFVGSKSFSQFVREALRSYLDRLEQEALAREMADGYSAEAGSSSLESDWAAVETDGWS